MFPEGLPVANHSPWEDVCYEVVDDVEEEAVIQISRAAKKQPRVFSHPSFHFPVHFCFERQWLTACSLRL